jgi:hypothetical protein
LRRRESTGHISQPPVFNRGNISAPTCKTRMDAP